MEQQLRIANNSANAVGELLEEIRTYNKPWVSTRDYIDFSEIIHGVRKSMEEDRKKCRFPPKIYVTNKLSDHARLLWLDRMAMERVLVNLLSNAIQALDHVQQGRIDIQVDFIRYATGNNDGMLILQVEDNGPGIPKKIQTRVMTSYFTTRTRGTGLGLALVKKMVEEIHQGNIELISPSIKTGQGTLFKIRIPTHYQTETGNT